ncbi:SH3 domain-containing protein [Roseomonas elaeocarpi]|uniref:SH3 domain-containing protein n=1 Tax=Roseomonas elaeocarpi TaxID=907779 RepID=A0ABV6JNW6_9PROT
MTSRSVREPARKTIPAGAAPLLRKLALGLALTVSAVAPALAAPGFATGNVNLRAGPGTAYPQVTVLGAGQPVEIFGCLEGYNWCDVGANGTRGWVAGSYLQYVYEGQRVLVPDYGPRIGLPIVGFAFGDYWGRYYRGRSWYADRDRWGGPPPPPRPDWRGGPPGGPPGGPGWHGGPPGGPAGGPGWRGGPPGGPPGGGPGWEHGPGPGGPGRGPGPANFGGPGGPRGEGPGGPRGEGPGGGPRGPDGGPGGPHGPGEGPGGPGRGPG